MQHFRLIQLLVLSCLLVGAIATGVGAEVERVSAEFINRDGNSVGSVTLTQQEDGVEINVSISGLDIGSGAKGIHIYENGACDAPDFESAGGHYNPSDAQHGLDNPDGPHAGDGPDITIYNGAGNYRYVNERVTLAELTSGNGSAIIISSDSDDQVTDPDGNSGMPMACAAIAGTGMEDDSTSGDDMDNDEPASGNAMTVRWTNIYAAPDSTTSIGEALPPNTPVNVIATQGAWSQIESGLGNGWVPSNALSGVATPSPMTSTNGFGQASSDSDVAAVFDSLSSALEAAGPIGIVAELDHQANAARVDLELRPTKIVMFGNPMLGTPLMQQNQLTGLDLPQKMLVYEDAAGDTQLIYNSADYLAQRHGLAGAPQLEKISGALAMFASKATGGTVELNPSNVTLNQGIVIKQSAYSVEESYSRIKTTLENNAAIGIVAELDHQANAARVDLELRPTKLIVFGNPLLGTPLMQQAQTHGLDLPQKFLVYEDAAGDVYVAYNDPAYVAQRHGVSGADEVIGKIAGALNNISNGATMP